MNKMDYDNFVKNETAYDFVEKHSRTDLAIAEIAEIISEL
jgi:hypothetical protein